MTSEFCTPNSSYIDGFFAISDIWWCPRFMFGFRRRFCTIFRSISQSRHLYASFLLAITRTRFNQTALSRCNLTKEVILLVSINEYITSIRVRIFQYFKTFVLLLWKVRSHSSTVGSPGIRHQDIISSNIRNSKLLKAKTPENDAQYSRARIPKQNLIDLKATLQNSKVTLSLAHAEWKW